ncbi:response regulator transcription factor [Litoribacillus peritrichatus]|uniref:Envelope stress response regulator transcription factor CpxR n=1 Tax=Litoribacillus peritrichatus TaxID=718191 RepID=A0ABP7N230_9GAMM
MTQVLLVDDDQSLNELLSTYLSNEGFSVEQAFDGEQALKKINTSPFDIVILDIMMPVKNGIDTLRDLRRDHQTPVIMLTAKSEDIDRIIGLEMGADDYLPKPCNPRELIARIRAILRRTSAPSLSGDSDESNRPDQPSHKKAATQIRVGKLTLNTARFEAHYDQQPITLTGAEFKLLQVMLSHPGAILSKAQLSLDVLNRPLEAYDRSIDVHVSNLRKKLAGVEITTDIISNIRGQGYLFKHELLTDELSE